MKNMDTLVCDAYIASYPECGFGQYIDCDITFGDVLGSLDRGDNIYDVIGVYDSIVRECIFEQLAVVMGVCYDEVYYRWLNKGCCV